MNLLKRIAIGYLMIGILFALLVGGSINPIHLSTWANVILWLPLVVIYWFWRLLTIMVLIAVVLAILSLFVPQVKAYLVAAGQKLRS